MFIFTDFNRNRVIEGSRKEVLEMVRAYCHASTKFKGIGMPLDGAKGRWVLLRFCEHIIGPCVEGYLVQED